MLKLIKQTWSEWKDLKTWQQVLILLPLLLLTLICGLYIFSPIKFKKLEEELLGQNKKSVNTAVKFLNKEDKKLAKEQQEIKIKRTEIKEKMIENEKEAEDIIKDIDNADGDITKLIGIHKRLNTRIRDTL
jgi:septal ring factor EnvC (AmiA/AmiB activator)